MSCLRTQMRYLNAYDAHKLIINEYVLKRPGDTQIFKRDTSKDKTDADVIRKNHRFLWEGEDKADTWELQFAKKYYDKLFREYCIADLSLYRENKLALRWRIKQEVIIGKGQFICGNKKCCEKEDLRTWEVNFRYMEEGKKKNALIKIRLCPECSRKLNYHSKKREVKRLKRKPNKEKKKHIHKSKDKESSIKPSSSAQSTSTTCSEGKNPTKESSKESPWENHKPEEVKSREEEMEDYLEDLLL
ncbi:unnamed protein product [Brassicogethes aeneus]|uniref:Protein FRA10AC1 n=1 Tax=Brassicogethes aeneus TaxID=1431903 RepID=A0A9P0B225_BRAAE|nr:unnamed protein product [Brassicogethes aeneus]